MFPDSYILLPLMMTILINLYNKVDGLLRGFLLLRVLTGVLNGAEMALFTGCLRNHLGQKHVTLGEIHVAFRVIPCNWWCRNMQLLRYGVNSCSNRIWGKNM